MKASPNPHSYLAAASTCELLTEVLRRVELEDGRRIMSLHVAELQRRCQDYDRAVARHPAGQEQ
jgi:hypothetical protein